MLAPLEAELLAALKEVVRISDRKHDAWDNAHAAIARAESDSAKVQEERENVVDEIERLVKLAGFEIDEKSFDEARAYTESQSGPVVAPNLYATMAELRDAAQDRLGDLESNIDDGADDQEAYEDAVERLSLAITRADTLLSRSQSGPMPGDTPGSGEPGVKESKELGAAKESKELKPLVLVTVSGGVAEAFCDPPGAVLVAIYDIDNGEHVPELADENRSTDWALVRDLAETEAEEWTDENGKDIEREA